MKREVLKAMLGLAVVATISMAGLTVSATDAETETETATEVVTEVESETETETEAAPDVNIEYGEWNIVLKNESGIVITEAVFEESEAAEEETETETEDSSVVGILTLKEEDGTEHIYENVELSGFNEPVLVKEDAFLFIHYVNVEGEDKTAAETADEVEFEEPITMYAVGDVYVRAEANSDSEALGVASLGKEYTVIAATPKWLKIETEELTGYVSRAYLSADKESADAAVQAEEAAAAQAQAAAAAAAAQAAQSQTSQSQGGQSSVYEVSRVKYEDCDGSGHGYYEVTYSDGSVEIEEF